MATFDPGKAVNDGVRIGRAFASVFIMLIRPLILTTRVIIRKDLGERYLTPLNAMVGAILIVGAAWMTVAMPVKIETVVADRWGMPTRSLVIEDRATAAYVIGGVWAVLYLVGLIDHRIRLRNRYANGIRWHSRCSGVPRLPNAREWAVYVAAGGIAFLGFYNHLPLLAVLLVGSIAFAILEDGHAAAEFWGRVLDAVDGQIESENLGKAVKDRLTPDRAEGVHAPVPGYVKDAYRLRVAEAIGISAQRSSTTASTIELKPLASPSTTLVGSADQV